MKSKFKFLVKDSFKKKTSTKAFKIANLILCILIVAVVNIDSIIKLFGGGYDDLTNVYIYDDVGIYDSIKNEMETSILNAVSNYNIKIDRNDLSLDELKEKIINEESNDIIVNVKSSDQATYDKLFTAEIISYEKMDSTLYASITSALNEVKKSKALDLASINEKTLDAINKAVDIDRILLNENATDELTELIGLMLVIIFILPFFVLINYIVQMIGAEINEEKSSRGMEIIISSVSPETHFMSKLVSVNLFALLQGLLLIVYVFMGLGVRTVLSSPVDMASAISAIAESEDIGVTTSEVSMLIDESQLASKLAVGIPAILVLIVLSFIAYTLFIGILASVTTTMEDYSHVQTPVMLLLMVGYLLAIYSTLFPNASFINVMSYIPFVSAILAPVTYMLGGITIWGLLITIGILCATIYLLYHYGLKVYKVGILNYSSSNLWKKIFKALKD